MNYRFIFSFSVNGEENMAKLYLFFKIAKFFHKKCTILFKL